MRGTVLKIPLGKKDRVLKQWHKVATTYEHNISKTIEYAIIYYMNTGEYLPVGNINISEDIPTTAINLYFSENSLALSWINKITLN